MGVGGGAAKADPGRCAAAFFLFAAALALNVSLILYSRQCRYYGPSILLSVVVAYWYDTFDGSWRRLAAQ